MWVVDLSAAQKEKTKEVLKSKNPNTVHLRIEILPQSTLLAESVDEDEMMSTMRKLFHAPRGATLQIEVRKAVQKALEGFSTNISAMSFYVDITVWRDGESKVR